MITSIAALTREAEPLVCVPWLRQGTSKAGSILSDDAIGQRFANSGKSRV